MSAKRSYILFGGIITLLTGVMYTAYWPTQGDFNFIVCGYTLSFLGYAIAIHAYGGESSLVKIFAVFIPTLLLFSTPNLSDDIYRFIWDGYNTVNGISPYKYMPSDLVQLDIPYLDQGLYDQLNSKSYFSIYPTVNQLLFATTVLMSKSFATQVIILKVFYLIVHLIGVKLLFQMLENDGKSLQNGMLYAFNPLVIIEGIGNLHAEVLMVAFLFISYFFWRKYRMVISAFFFAMAIHVKLLPLLFLGYFIVRINQSQYRNYLMKVLMFSALFAVPIMYGLVSGGFLNSLDLYFRKFEFNASFYYVLRWLGYQVFGYNIISYLGPLLMLLFVSLVIVFLKRKRNDNSIEIFIVSALVVLTLFFLCSTTIHPWYVIGLLAFSPFVSYRYMILWSYIITFTYINYSYHPYHENLFVVFFEYTILIFVLVFELFLHQRTARISNI